MPYQPIEDYGMIGDMHTVALVGINGSIDWLCVPDFDSPSVFAAILDDDKGGRFKIAPLGKDVVCKQFYWPETNVLITRFLAPDGAAELTDFMPAGRAVSGNHHRHCLVRRVTVVRGTLKFLMECHPAFNYGRDDHTVTITNEGAILGSPALSLGLATSTPLQEQNGTYRWKWAAGTPCRRKRRKSYSGALFRSGMAGLASADIQGDGEKWFIARHWPSRC
jgi:GH15 family glucan-1,4-alpha-glucosidase